jgi:hypothetical protein
MLDLRAKLLNAGLVTEEAAKKAEAEANSKKRSRSTKKKGKGKGESAEETQKRLWKKRLAELAEAPKGERYDAIRKWVTNTRLDKSKGLPSENAVRHHFAREDGTITWLTVEPEVQAQISEGQAAIVAFMSHHGLTHAVVPADVARDIGHLFPEWLRGEKGGG